MTNGKNTIKVLKLTLVILASMVLMSIILLVFQRQVGSIWEQIDNELVEYDKYYVLIADESDSILWESVYEGAVEAGAEVGVYVEFIEHGVEYTIQEKLRIAIDSNVDGIIISSDDLEETSTLIEEALEKEIVVVTVLNDDTDSLRKSFVGINNYTLGETYGEIIWKYITEEREEEGDCTISILMDSSNEDTGKNTTYLGMNEYLDKMVEETGWIYNINIETVSMNRDETFIAEETIGELILDGNSDIMICLSAMDTETAYRMVVDYNAVGTIEILGYYESEVILEAIEKNIIHSTITIDGQEVGNKCVMAVYEYQETGYVNAYFPVEIKVVDQSNVEESLTRYEEVSGVEDVE